MNCLQNIILDHMVNITMYCISPNLNLSGLCFLLLIIFNIQGYPKQAKWRWWCLPQNVSFHQIIRPSNAPVWKFNLLSVIFEVMRCVLGSELNLWISLQGFIQIQDIIWGEELQTLWERPWTPISGGCYTSRLTKQLIMISCINCFAQLYFLIMFLTTASCERNARNGGNLELLGKNTKMRKYF